MNSDPQISTSDYYSPPVTPGLDQISSCVYAGHFQLVDTPETHTQNSNSHSLLPTLCTFNNV